MKELKKVMGCLMVFELVVDVQMIHVLEKEEKQVQMMAVDQNDLVNYYCCCLLMMMMMHARLC